MASLCHPVGGAALVFETLAASAFLSFFFLSLSIFVKRSSTDCDSPTAATFTAVQHLQLMSSWSLGRSAVKVRCHHKVWHRRVVRSPN